MPTQTSSTCQICFRPVALPGSEPKTQWFYACRCERPYSPNSQFSIDICGNCKRRVPAQTNDSFQSPGLCSCPSPNAQKLASNLKQGELDPVSLDPTSLKIQADSFPLDKYAPIAFLGDSPRATTLLCRDRARGSKVAVKCFKRIAPAMHATFQSEAKKIQPLTHPNIAKVVDVGVQGTTPYLVSAYKDGFDLDQYIAMHGTPSPEVAIKILIGVCEALKYAKSQGIMHQDLRPGNILFIDDMNSEPSVVLTDFALPKCKFAETPLTAWDALYLSGEEARNMDFTENCEVYNLGNIGYDLLTGRAPFSGSEYQEIKNQHALKLPPRISNVKPDMSRPGELDEIIEKCLEKDPRTRFESPAKLMERLEVFPRRVQMLIENAMIARKRRQITKIAGIAAAAIAVLSIIGFFAFNH